jgi:UPF0755 protein
MVKKSQKYKLFRYIAVIITAVFICFIATILVLFFWPQNEMDRKVKITVPEGATLSEISDILEEKEIISNKNMFMIATSLMGYSNQIPAGIFALKDADNNYAIVRQLVNSNQSMVRVTIREGWTIKDVARTLADSLDLSSEIITALCYDEQFIEELGIESNSLEGYLYPDTYLFLEIERDPKEILKQIIFEFNKVFTDELRNRAELLGFSINETLAMASLIEGEAIFDTERAIVSSVYHNRLRKGMLLQADPTIQFIIDDGPRRLTLSDLKIDSPYNTYLYQGLPPGPISNPGRSSIIAALYPDETDYLFFVARGDGYHTFTRNYEEHNRAKREFQKVRQAARQG